MKNQSPSKKALPTPEERASKALKHALSFENREAKLCQSEDVDDAFIEEYKKTEVLRQSVKDVKERAKEEQDKRKNIRHVNDSAKSMVAANMKAVSKGKKIQQKEVGIPQW